MRRRATRCAGLVTIDLPMLAAHSDRAQRGVVAHHDRRHLSRGRHPQAVAGDATAIAHHPDRARDRQAAVHGDHAGCDDPGRQTILPGGHRRAVRVVCACAALQHIQHRVDWIPGRQRGSHRALRAADRHVDPVSNARRVRVVRADRRRSRRRSQAWPGCCRSPTPCRCWRYLARRGMDRASRRRRRAWA